jgi:hypothetical protein
MNRIVGVVVSFLVLGSPSPMLAGPKEEPWASSPEAEAEEAYSFTMRTPSGA